MFMFFVMKVFVKKRVILSAGDLFNRNGVRTSDFCSQLLFYHQNLRMTMILNLIM